MAGTNVYFTASKHMQKKHLVEASVCHNQYNTKKSARFNRVLVQIQVVQSAT